MDWLVCGVPSRGSRVPEDPQVPASISGGPVDDALSQYRHDGEEVKAWAADACNDLVAGGETRRAPFCRRATVQRRRIFSAISI